MVALQTMTSKRASMEVGVRVNEYSENWHGYSSESICG